MYLLDTSVLIPFLKGRNGIQEHIGSVGVSKCHIPELALGELLVGAYKSNNRTELGDVLHFRDVFGTCPVTFAVWDRYAQLRTLLERQGNRIDNMDLLIAATALEGDYTLVTHNIAHFSRIPGLKLEDWVI